MNYLGFRKFICLVAVIVLGLLLGSEAAVPARVYAHEQTELRAHISMLNNVPEGNRWKANWNGYYTGWYDGRRASLVIMANGSTVGITFKDIDRNETYAATYNVGDISSTHEMTNITLQPFVQGHSPLHWSKLLLHTWNMNYVSGVSMWNGQEYGMSFSRALFS